MAFTIVKDISGTECMGSSRQKIVDNFVNLQDHVLSLSSSVISPFNTPTINLNYNTSNRFLSANIQNLSVDNVHLAPNAVSTLKIRDNAITFSKLTSWQSVSSSTSLSAEVVQPRLARAWVNFNGTGTIGSDQIIRSSFNVSSVTKNGVGDYTINFSNPLPDSNYAFALGHNWQGTSVNLGMLNTGIKTTSQFQIYMVDTGQPGNVVDPSQLNCIIFGN